MNIYIILLTEKLSISMHSYKLIPVAYLALIIAGCSKPAPDPVLPVPPPETKPGTTFSANPNPIIIDAGPPVGETTLYWTTTAKNVEVHLDAPDGKLFGGGPSTGSLHTGLWASNGMTFYLQDSTHPNPLSPEATLGKLTISVQ